MDAVNDATLLSSRQNKNSTNTLSTICEEVVLIKKSNTELASNAYDIRTGDPRYSWFCICDFDYFRKEWKTANNEGKTHF